ncbi:MAG: 3-hydroxyacyl-CoA dehydrogenase family protein [Clostridiales Family XIII bacterium]|jgi:3-hydroxybutyryl-CoA dehydrogenase|nr:3-hydroxyacyl-CoA dehydrogenase family protein [Clostridiales Family XIII bacterium]
MKRDNEISNIVIAGGGVMGASMAQIFAEHGKRVSVYDISEESIRRGEELVALSQRERVRDGTLTETASRETAGRISFVLTPDVFENADYVVECIVENMDVKQAFWRKISAIAPENIVLATNTSGLSISEIAKAVKAPARFAGMHWVNPPHLTPLVEVIAGEETAEETMDVVYGLALSVGRKPVRVKKDARGFVLNRLQFALLREAMHIVESGIAGTEDVDKVMKYGLGLRYACVGPFETADLGGLDTFYRIAEYLFPDLSDSKEVPALLARHYRAGEYGTKTGRGFYDYPGDAAEQAVSRRDRRLADAAGCLIGERETEVTPPGQIRSGTP